MEMKIGQVTHGDAQKANNAHYEANNQIMEKINPMTLGGKKKLIDKLDDHVKAAEDEANS